MIVNSEQINFIKEQYKNGSIISNNYFYQGNLKIRKANVIYQYTDAEREIITKCAESELFFYETFFANKYKLYEAHFKYMNILINDKFVINLTSRQSKVILLHAIHFLWLSLFKIDLTNVIVDCKRDNGIEILDKIKELYYELPYYIQVGVKNINQTSIAFDNNSKIKILDCRNIPIGMTINNILLNNFAFYDNYNLFSNVLLPTISVLRESSVIINSTPNGNNLFYDMYDKAKKGLNKFTPFEMLYTIIPERDENWKKARIAEIGEKAFKQEYELSFGEDDETTEITKEDLIKEIKELKSMFKKLMKKIDKINI
jgi:hypothetical protein